MKYAITVALLALSVAPVANAAPIEQIGCVYDGVATDIRDKIDATAMQNGEIPPAAQAAMEAALTTCMMQHSWSQADSENATRYFMMQSIAENAHKAMVGDHIKVAQGYFAENEAEFVGSANFLDADPDKIIGDLTSRGIPAVEENQKDAAMYLYWLVITQQLRGDFVAGKLRD